MSRASGGRGKRQRFNSGENKGVKVVPRRMLKRGGVITRPQPGGIQAGRPRPTRQAGENPRPLFDELSAGASDLLDAISRLEEYDGEGFAGWDDFTVALIGPVRKVLGYDASQMDYFDMMAWDEEAAVREAEKRLQRLTKAQLIATFRRVMIALVAYWDIKGSFDTLSAVVNELDSRAAVLANGTPSQAMWVE